MKQMFKYFSFSIILILSGCGNNPKEANETNFSQAINNYINSDKSKLGCINVSGLKLSGYSTKQFEELAEQGFLIYKIEKIKPKLDFFTGKTITERKDYQISEKAKPFYKDNQICVGEVKLNKIIQFTEPIQIGPYKMSEVTYNYKIIYPDWVKNDKNKLLKKRAGVILTNNGWIHEKLYKK